MKIQIENGSIRIFRTNEQILHDIIYEVLNYKSKAVVEQLFDDGQVLGQFDLKLDSIQTNLGVFTTQLDKMQEAFLAIAGG